VALALSTRLGGSDIPNPPFVSCEVLYPDPQFSHVIHPPRVRQSLTFTGQGAIVWNLEALLRASPYRAFPCSSESNARTAWNFRGSGYGRCDTYFYEFAREPRVSAFHLGRSYPPGRRVTGAAGDDPVLIGGRVIECRLKPTTFLFGARRESQGGYGWKPWLQPVSAAPKTLA
jgi:hypothetical protein